MTLDGRIAIVTGAARGIGKATALALADGGADVAVFDLLPEIEETAAAIDRCGRRSLARTVDITDSEAVKAAVDAVSETLGGADILANVAGIVANIAPLATMDPAAWSREIDVNLSGAFYMTQATIGAMVAKGWGRIVNVSSVVARGGLSHQVGYSASKSGLLGLARNVAIEHGDDGVTCNTVLPGFVETETVLAMPGGIRDGLLELTPVGRFGAPEEVAALIRFLCGPDSGYLNGAEIDIDGGFRLCPVSLASRRGVRIGKIERGPMINLMELAGLGRKVRQDDLDDLGVPTQDKILEALDDGRSDDARDLIAYMIPEGKALHDLFCDWLWDVFTKIADRHGEEEMHAIMKATQETWMMKRTWKAFRDMEVKTRLDLIAEIMRSHHCGPNQDGALTVTEDADRYTLWMDPCGSGGRMRRGDPVDGTPSRLGPPYNFGVTSKAYPWSWGRKNVPYYCLHCANMEILPIEWGDAPLWVTEYSDDAERPCAWHFYKSPEKIPDAVYARLGKSRPGT